VHRDVPVGEDVAGVRDLRDRPRSPRGTDAGTAYLIRAKTHVIPGLTFPETYPRNVGVGKVEPAAPRIVPRGRGGASFASGAPYGNHDLWSELRSLYGLQKLRPWEGQKRLTRRQNLLRLGPRLGVDQQGTYRRQRTLNRGVEVILR